MVWSLWCVCVCVRTREKSGSERGSFGKGVFSKKPIFVAILENLEILEIPQTVENRRDPDHFLEILSIPEFLEILEIAKTLS